MEDNYEIIDKIQNGTLTELKHFIRRNTIFFNEYIYEAAFISDNFNKIKILWDADERKKDIVLNEIYNVLLKKSSRWNSNVYNYFTELVNDYISNIIHSDNANNIKDKDNNSHNENDPSNEISLNEKSLFIEKLLMRAIRRNINSLVEYLVENGADINKRYEGGETPLIHAAKYSSDTTIHSLIRKGAHVNEKDTLGNTPLSYIVKRKHISKKRNAIKLLIEAGADVNKKDNEGKIPLAHLIERKVDNHDLINLFISKGSDINSIKLEVDISIFKYILRMEHPKLLTILYNNPMNVNQMDKYNKSMLDYALENEMIPLIIKLLENGASLQDSTYQYFYLINAVDNNNIGFAECLIKGGVDINHPNYEITPLNLAIHDQHIEIFRCLIEYGADVNQMDKKGDTPLTLAIIKDNEEMVNYLIHHEADVNQPNGRKETPLILALSRKKKTDTNTSERIINLLIDHGADVNHKSPSHKSPFLYAVEQNSLELVQKLKEYGSEFTPEDSIEGLLFSIKNNYEEMANCLIGTGMEVNLPSKKNHEVPLNYAIKNGRMTIVKELVEHGALLNQMDESHQTPLLYAIKGKNKGILKYLIEQGADTDHLNIDLTLFKGLLKLDEPIVIDILLNNNFDMSMTPDTKAEINPKGEKFENNHDYNDHNNINININKNSKNGNKPLLDYAIENENVTVVKYLIEHGADINRPLYKTKTKSRNNGIKNNHYLIFTINTVKNKHKRIKIVEYLIENGGAEYHYDDDHGSNSVLQAAIKKKDLVLIKYLRERGIEMNQPDKDGKTPLIDAVIQGSTVEILNYFIDLGLDINHEDRYGKTPLTYAIKYDKDNLVQWLIDHGARVNQRNKYNISPFEYAMAKISSEEVEENEGSNSSPSLHTLKYIIDNGLNVNEKFRDGKRPLIHGIEKRRKDIVQWLVERGADIQVVTRHHYKILFDLAMEGQTNDLLILLLDQGHLEINSIQNEKGETYLNYAIKQNNFDLVKYLVEHGANINRKNKNGMTPLICAIKQFDLLSLEEYKLPVIQYLVGHGANVNQGGGKQLKTPLIFAIMYEQVAIVNFLVENGANVNQTDSKGKHPLDYAFDILNQTILRCLIDHGAERPTD